MFRKQVGRSLVSCVAAQIRSVLDWEVGDATSAPPPRENLRAGQKEAKVVAGRDSDIRPKVNAMPKRRSVEKPNAGVQSPIVGTQSHARRPRHPRQPLNRADEKGDTAVGIFCQVPREWVIGRDGVTDLREVEF
ncbi:MAG: hypothetical protein RUDDFDWM_001997 [Candidatus Fervidibacterota bacterium]